MVSNEFQTGYHGESKAPNPVNAPPKGLPVEKNLLSEVFLFQRELVFLFPAITVIFSAGRRPPSIRRGLFGKGLGSILVG